MKFDKKLIEHLSRLSRIELDEKEKLKLQKDLNEIVEFASIVQKVKDPATPLYTLSQEHIELREDSVLESLGQSQVLSNAPFAKDGQFKVKSPIK